MKQVFFLITAFMVFLIPGAMAQGVGIGTTTPETSAKLDITDTARGVLIPRMTAAQRNAIVSPAQGLLVFVTSDSSFYFFKNGWQKIMAGNESWGLSGNAGINPATQFIGTTDDQPLRFKVSDINAGVISWTSGNTAFGPRALDTDNSGAYQNTAIGYYSSNRTKGAGNASFGAYSLRSNETGNYNIAIGYDALAGNIRGSQLTAIGINAGTRITTGFGNTFIGAFANAARDSLINATAIGYNAQVEKSNTLILGGVESLAVNVGIGTKMPNAPLQFANNNGRKIVLYEDANNDFYYGLAIDPSTLRYQSSGDHAFFAAQTNNSSLELLRIKSTGNIGIGESNPLQKLHVAGNVYVTDKLGIGVSAPHAPLHFGNGGSKKIILFEDADNDNSYYGFAIDPSTLRLQSGSDFAFFTPTSLTSSIELMRIKGNGNIGIGSSTYNEKLTINGAVKINDGGYTGLANNAVSPVPAGGAGTMVFSNGHFFGWNGTQWKQLDN